MEQELRKNLSEEQHVTNPERLLLEKGDVSVLEQSGVKLLHGQLIYKP